MTDDFNKDIIPTDWKQEDSIIKVVGVGGGGCIAVNHMFNQGIVGCSFYVCNSNASELSKYDVPTKIQLGEKTVDLEYIPAVRRTSDH